jgi:hypothetical protein
MTEFDLTYLSLGAGVQSSAMLVCSALGRHGVPKADVAIFADTGDEPGWVYEYLEALEAWSPIPIKRTTKGKLSERVVDRQRQGKRFVSVPIYTASKNGGREGMLRRQCTREFKLEPIYKAVRAELGLVPRQRFAGRVRCMIGISIDESIRMKPSRVKWITNVFPLVDAGLSRRACLDIVAEAGLPKPKRSACVYCPYHQNSTWRDLRDNHPEEWERAVRFDEVIRDMTMRGREQPGFVHRSCVPLAEADLSDGDRNQIEAFPEFIEECEGMCGV